MTVYERNHSIDSLDSVRDPWKYGQNFTVGVSGENISHNLISITLNLSRSGNPGVINCYLHAVDVDGFPTGAALSTGSIDGNALPVVCAPTDIPMSGYILRANTKYCFYVEAPTSDVANYLKYRFRSIDIYAGGKLIHNVAGTWVAETRDFYFAINGDYASDALYNMAITGNMTFKC